MAADTGRRLMLAVDESHASEKTLDWTLDNIYKAGDEVHVLHVIPSQTPVVLTTELGVAGLIEDDEATKQKVADHAQEFLKEKFMSKLEAAKIPYHVEVVRSSVDNDTIGALVCKHAEQLNAAVVVMAKHTRTAVKEFFVGSVTSYCTHHCKAPVLVMHCD